MGILFSGSENKTTRELGTIRPYKVIHFISKNDYGFDYFYNKHCTFVYVLEKKKNWNLEAV